jgi:hypothetical protein
MQPMALWLPLIAVLESMKIKNVETPRRETVDISLN